ncbi:hypothetical protein [Microbacterium sp. Root322]|uniref:hypothetical protein n=1 Tax=Microbacterium sp. Root322 TaxID=1736514 RepID=UPI0012FB48F8|nr:hypothetical protein [Microbacterium sp. Root322]
MSPIVQDIFAEVDAPQLPSAKCPESNRNHVSVVKSAFRVNGLKRGTRKREGESDRQYRSRLVFSEMVSQALRYINQFDGLFEDDMIASLVGLHTDEMNAEVGRRVSRDHQRYEARKAVAEARKMWSREKAQKIKATASKAGSVTKWTLEDFLETRDMKPSEALRYLRAKKGIKSRTTIDAMRKHFSGLNVETGEVT